MITSDGQTAWYIDALDVRAGMAFASQRGPDLHEALALDLPSVFIEPPGFRPVRISHRALGLSATRRSSQLGFFQRGREVGFRKLADIVEFTRRCYLRGAGRDGLERSDLSPFPGDPDGGGGDTQKVDLPGNAVFEAVVVRSIEALQALGGVRQAGATVEGQVYSWTDALIAESDIAQTQTDFRACFSAGAAILLDELMRRAARRSVDPDAWWASIEQFLTACDLLGLGREDLVQTDRRNYDSELQLLLDEQLHHELHWEKSWTARMGAYGPVPWRFHRRNIELDPNDLLDSLPVPAELSRFAIGTSDTRVSVHDFLAAFVAAPHGATLTHARVAIFAAAVNIATTQAWRSHARDLHHMARIGRQAAQWLAQQLPQRIFDKEVEEAIQSVSFRARKNEPPVPPAMQRYAEL